MTLTGTYADLALAGGFSPAPGSQLRPDPSGLTLTQSAWVKYGAWVAFGALAGAVVGGRSGVAAGALGGVAAVALFGDVTWTG
jgi:hypothetical protein